MKVKYASIFTIVLVLLSGIPLVSGTGVINNVSATYAPTNTQSQGNANDCDTGTNCAINSPQTQGDGSASSPTNLQITETNGLNEDLTEPIPNDFVIQPISCGPDDPGWVVCTGTTAGFPVENLRCLIAGQGNVHSCYVTISAFHLDHETMRCEIEPAIVPPQGITSASCR
jgi:hypothetical protein